MIPTDDDRADAEHFAQGIACPCMPVVERCDLPDCDCGYVRIVHSQGRKAAVPHGVGCP